MNCFSRRVLLLRGPAVCGQLNNRWDAFSRRKYYLKLSYVGATVFSFRRSQIILRDYSSAARILKRECSSSSIMSDQEQFFQGKIDRFNGVTVDSIHESCDTALFPIILKNSLVKWNESEVRAVWFKIALEHTVWVSHLAENGFRFHHAQPSYVVMVKWLPTNEVCNIPQYAHTMIGVGAIVLNEKKQILVVSEKYYKIPHWKLPGGYVEPGEEITAAAEREVLEETSVRAKFQMLVCFRHTHNAMFDCSDMYYIVALTPEPGQTVLKKCDREIAAVEWMDVDEYLKHPNVHSTNRFFVKKFLEYEACGVSLSSHKDTHPLLKKPYTVYSIDLSQLPHESTNSKM